MRTRRHTARLLGQPFLVVAGVPVSVALLPVSCHYVHRACLARAFRKMPRFSHFFACVWNCDVSVSVGREGNLGHLLLATRVDSGQMSSRFILSTALGGSTDVGLRFRERKSLSRSHGASVGRPWDLDPVLSELSATVLCNY